MIHYLLHQVKVDKHGHKNWSGRPQWRWKAVNAGNYANQGNGGERYKNLGDCVAGLLGVCNLSHKDERIFIRYLGEKRYSHFCFSKYFRKKYLT